MTLIFITHRLNAINDANKIVLLDKGSISEIGNHKSLIDKAERYFALYSQQSSDNL